FHDDTFFHPDTALNIERFAAMENALQNRSMTDIAIQVKARTDAITPPVLDILRRIGLFRVFLGVENHSADGLKSLGKGTTVEQNRRALNLLRAAKLHATFNLLMFGPDTTFDQLRENIASIREFGDMPVNFGRVEVYSGTPLERDLRHRGRLKGDFFGYHYEIADPLVQNIFEIFRAVFTERNFQVTGMNFAAMKLDYYHQILAHFHPAMADEQLFLAKKDLIERLNRSNADLLSRICDEAGPNAERNRDLSRRLLRMRRNYDRKCAREFEALIREIEHRARSKNIAAGTLPKKAVAVTAAAAAILISSQRCNINVTVDSAPTAPRQPDTINRQAELPQLDSSEVALVEQRINSAYKTGVDSLGSALGFVNRPLQFNLCLDSSGSVDSCAILHPARDSAPAFADAVLARIRTWTFPDIRRSGTCGITMVVASEDTGWHICEIIGYPLDSVTPPPVDSVLPPLAEYRGADSQMVINKFYAEYIGAVDSLCSAYGCIGRQFSIRVVVDSAGRVINCTVSVSGADTLPPGFAPAVSSLALGWRFPGVSRKGYCVITTGIIVVVPPTIYEIMAFPRDTNP
ncbi:MAG: radical SAM protein, partial [Terracidiphilus sp.]